MPKRKEKWLRILIVSHNARDEGGVCNFIRTLKLRLHFATLITRFTNGPRRHERTRVDKARRMICDYIRFAPLVIWKRFDVVHFNPEMDLRSFPRESLFMALLILMHKRNFIVFFHGWNWDAFKTIASHWYLRIWLIGVLKRAGRILVLSEKFRLALVKEGVPFDHVEVTTTMFDGRWAVSERNRDQANLAKPKLLFVGRFVKEKGVYELIEAVALLKLEFSNVTLAMAGSGPELNRMRETVNKYGLADRISFPGYVRGRRKARLLAEASIFVFPSYHWEGMPIALLEAMGAGLPILASPVGGIPEIMREPENGLFLTEVSGPDIAEKLRKVLSNVDYLVHTGARNKEEAWKKYESVVVSAEMERIYHSTSQ